jgi:tetratricopeptide (TPR) repeat protein
VGGCNKKSSGESTAVSPANFKPVDTSLSSFQVKLEDIRRTYTQDLIYTRPQEAKPIELLQKGLETSLNVTTNPKRKASILLTLATMAFTRSSAPDATVQSRYLSDAIKYASASGYVEAEAVAHGKLAMVYECQNNLEAARNEVQLALETHKRLKMNEETAIDLCNLGVIEANNDKANEAMPHFEEALKLARKSKSDVAIAFCLCNLGECYADISGLNGNTQRLNTIVEELQKYRKLTVPFFCYYRKLSFGGLYYKAVGGDRQFYNFIPNWSPQNGSPIPLGYIEAPYELPWP